MGVGDDVWWRCSHSRRCGVVWRVGAACRAVVRGACPACWPGLRPGSVLQRRSALIREKDISKLGLISGQVVQVRAGWWEGGGCCQERKAAKLLNK